MPRKRWYATTSWLALLWASACAAFDSNSVVSVFSPTTPYSGSGGTGTYVAKAGQYGLVLTADHVTESNRRARVTFPSGYQAWGVVTPHPWADASGIVFSPIPVGIEPTPIAKQAPRAGDTVWAYGYGGQQGLVRWSSRLHGYKDGGHRFVTDPVAISGDSGGPLLTNSGEICGIVTGGVLSGYGGRAIDTHGPSLPILQELYNT